jgi:hypothetical protein
MGIFGKTFNGTRENVFIGKGLIHMNLRSRRGYAVVAITGVKGRERGPPFG